MLQIKNLPVGTKDILKESTLKLKQEKFMRLWDQTVPENQHYLLSLLETKIASYRRRNLLDGEEISELAPEERAHKVFSYRSNISGNSRSFGNKFHQNSYQRKA